MALAACNQLFIACLSLVSLSLSCGAAGFQNDRRVKLYDTDNNWRLRKDVEARNLRWTITDTCISPDQKFLLYSSISPIVHLVWASFTAFGLLLLLPLIYNTGYHCLAVAATVCMQSLHKLLSWIGTFTKCTPPPADCHTPPHRDVI